jgi:hypothetical protein
MVSVAHAIGNGATISAASAYRFLDWHDQTDAPADRQAGRLIGSLAHTDTPQSRYATAKLLGIPGGHEESDLVTAPEKPAVAVGMIALATGQLTRSAINSSDRTVKTIIPWRFLSSVSADAYTIRSCTVSWLSGEPDRPIAPTLLLILFRPINPIAVVPRQPTPVNHFQSNGSTTQLTAEIM